jgi:L-threonylcarbamoyladenylate synthase
MDSIKNHHTALNEAVHTLADGGIIAYPTEAVYGLGCDPFNEDAVTKLLAIKQRDKARGLILVVSDWEQCNTLIKPLEPMMQTRIEASWPSHTTWVFPAGEKAPAWITGTHESIAIRMSAHPIVHELCTHFGKPIVSTSANIQGFPSIRDLRTLKIGFEAQLDFIMPGALGGAAAPSVIKDAITGEILRA